MGIGGAGVGVLPQGSRRRTGGAAAIRKPTYWLLLTEGGITMALGRGQPVMDINWISEWSGRRMVPHSKLRPDC